MKQAESPIDVKMYEFGRLLDEVLDTSLMCEIANDHQHARARAHYKEARERLMESIRIAQPARLCICLSSEWFGIGVSGKDSRRKLLIKTERPMAGHNGWGATRGGSIPRARFTIGLPDREVVMEFGLIASEVVRAAKELNVSHREAIDVLRYASILECSDDQADAIVALLR